VSSLVAVLRCLNEQVAALERQLAARFGTHPDAAIVQSLPGLGVVLGARVLGEFGDDPARYETANGRKPFAGTAPVTRASGDRTVVVARSAGKQRLADACYLWAFANRLVGILHGCLARRVGYDEGVPGLSRSRPRPDHPGWGCRGGRGVPSFGCWPACLPGTGGADREPMPRGQARWDGRARWLMDQAPPKAAPHSRRVRPHTSIALDQGHGRTPASC
jgi:Transposase IS116/IS110/IS902 family